MVFSSISVVSNALRLRRFTAQRVSADHGRAAGGSVACAVGAGLMAALPEREGVGLDAGATAAA